MAPMKVIILELSLALLPEPTIWEYTAVLDGYHIFKTKFNV